MKEPRRQKGKPTIESRLDAIVQTLEIVAGMQLETEKELTRLSRDVGRLSKDLGHLSKLSRIVMTSHEARIKQLERKKGA